MNPQVKQKLIDFLNERIKINEEGKSVGIRLCWGNMFHPDKDHYSIDAILCEIYMKENGLDWTKDTWKYYSGLGAYDGSKGSRFLCMGHSTSMPKEVMKWAGVGFIDHKFQGYPETKKEALFQMIETL